ncbi:heterokaryon incompatibility protein-domain-containing protein [Cubamyces lactineus]|nr:heterokaryon incompatibility protein-domain-containing protein [Cubamyces lactineus]
MWLLSTDHLALRFFTNPAAELPEGYAILSHVWQEREQTFQDVQSLQSGGVLYSDPRVCPKLRECARIAKAHGFEWMWIDTCCIDKTSSAELEEAINSMFRWYAEARTCFAYLHDVPDDEHELDAHRSAFRSSKWFTRGWTLQELIAPHDVLFMSTKWTYLGTKASLAGLLEGITGVDAEVLTFSKALCEVSVSRRMSWAATRQTKRTEDEAYSLMGLFGITMPTIYGEGKDAFRRLQEEIMKRTPDLTLLAWGDVLPIHMLESPRPVRPSGDEQSLIFAPSPASFAGAAEFVPLSLAELESLIEDWVVVEGSIAKILREPVVTSHGIRCRFIHIEGRPFSLALLPCRNEMNHCLALIVWRSPQSEPNLPQYFVGTSFSSGSHANPVRSAGPSLGSSQVNRLVSICPSTINTLLDLGWVHGTDTSSSSTAPYTESLAGLPQWRNVAQPHEGEAEDANTMWDWEVLTGTIKSVYIPHILRPSLSSHWTQHFWTKPQRFSFPIWFSQYLEGYQFESANTQGCQGGRVQSPSLQVGQALSPYQEHRFVHRTSGESFTIRVGWCRNHQSSQSSPLVATVEIAPAGNPDGIDEYINPHSCISTKPRGRQLPSGNSRSSSRPHRDELGEACQQNHVSRWKNGTTTIGDTKRAIQLTATRWPAAESDCYCLEVRVKGTVYSSFKVPWGNGASANERLATRVPITPAATPGSAASSGSVSVPKSTIWPLPTHVPAEGTSSAKRTFHTRSRSL